MWKRQVYLAGLGFLIVFLIDGAKRWLEGGWPVPDLIGAALSIALMATFWKHRPGSR